MATLAEINDVAAGGNALADKVKGAMLVAAQAIITEDTQTANHANRLKWAKRVFADVNGNADDVLKAVTVWANAVDTDITPAEMNALSDSTVVSYVAAVINVFADGE